MEAVAAYEDLVAILRHVEFEADHLVGNPRRLSKMSTRLPLVSVQSHDVTISEQRSHSSAQAKKGALTISPTTHLQQILRNPEIISKLYFGPGVEAEKRSELWHGELWKESPLLGDHELVTSGGNACSFRLYWLALQY
jgi:hypothetical protein